MMRTTLICLAAFAAIFAIGQAPAQAAPKEVALAIEDVTVIDPESRSILAHRSVFVDGDKIVAVTNGRAASRYRARRTVAGSGKYLIPGLMDMHAHVAHPHFSRGTLALFLANGVTGVREMSGDCWLPDDPIYACIDQYRTLQAALAAGQISGPRILRISSAFVHGPWGKAKEGYKDFYRPANRDQGRQLAQYLKARGVDFIKIYDDIPPEAYRGLAEQARTLNLEFSGHVPVAIGVAEASQLGQRTIEHARNLPYDCSPFGDEYRQAAIDAMSGKQAEEPPEPVRLEKTIAGFDPVRCAKLLQQLVANGTYYVPTHVTRAMDAFAGEASFRDEAKDIYVDPRLRDNWKGDLNQTLGASAELNALYRRFFDHGLMITRLAFQAGVPIMAGTDSNDTLMFPGFRLHDELAYLAKAGLPPMDVLRAATTIPARYLGETRSLGGIAVGKRADLILLDASPLRDVANSRSIAMVVIGGKPLDRAALDGLLESARNIAAGPPQ